MIAIQDSEGREKEIGVQILRTKQGDVAKLDMTYNFPPQLQDCLSGKNDKTNESFISLGNILSETQENSLFHHWMKAEEEYPLALFLKELNEGSLN